MKKFLAYILAGFNYKYYYSKAYLVNIKSGEVHRLSTITQFCVRYMAEHNKLYLSEYDLTKYLEIHPYANGCFHCYHEKDTDKKYRNGNG